MKAKIRLLTVCFAAIALLSACSPEAETPQPTNVTDTPPSVSMSVQETSQPSGLEYSPQWSSDEFRQDEEDWLLFAPSTDDYMLTEAYKQEQPDTGIVYTLTILRSFDKSGKVVAQIEKLTFSTPPDAEFCYETFSQDGKDYPSLVCTGYSVYVEQTDKVIATQRTKEQFVSDYQADGIKHWLSIP